MTHTAGCVVGMGVEWQVYYDALEEAYWNEKDKRMPNKKWCKFPADPRFFSIHDLFLVSESFYVFNDVRRRMIIHLFPWHYTWSQGRRSFTKKNAFEKLWRNINEACVYIRSIVDIKTKTISRHAYMQANGQADKLKWIPGLNHVKPPPCMNIIPGALSWSPTGVKIFTGTPSNVVSETWKKKTVKNNSRNKCRSLTWTVKP
jgi:hypothetical protein